MNKSPSIRFSVAFLPLFIYYFLLFFHILGDGPELYMCDTCPKSFCVDCITRNFGKKESNIVRALKIWSCYCCFPPEKLKKMMIDENTPLLNIDAAYCEVKPPTKNLNLNTNNIYLYKDISDELRHKLKKEERNLLQLFTDNISNSNNSIFQQIGIIEYLTSRDVRTLHQISPNIREVLKSIMAFPGLFRTQFGENENCRLYGEILFIFVIFIFVF